VSAGERHKESGAPWGLTPHVDVLSEQNLHKRTWTRGPPRSRSRLSAAASSAKKEPYEMATLSEWRKIPACVVARDGGA